jgi:hypothetical protein
MTVYVRAMLNRFTQLPAVITSDEVTVNVPLQLSVATTAVVLGAGTADAQLTVTLVGMLVITGGI